MAENDAPGDGLLDCDAGPHVEGDLTPLIIPDTSAPKKDYRFLHPPRTGSVGPGILGRWVRQAIKDGDSISTDTDRGRTYRESLEIKHS